MLIVVAIHIILVEKWIKLGTKTPIRFCMPTATLRACTLQSWLPQVLPEASQPVAVIAIHVHSQNFIPVFPVRSLLAQLGKGAGFKSFLIGNGIRLGILLQ